MFSTFFPTGTSVVQASSKNVSHPKVKPNLHKTT